MSYVDQVLDRVISQNPAQPEFHQAVREFLATVRPVIEENEAVGISSVSREPLATPRFYDLQGRCITHPSKGIYISGGHKYIIR